MNILVNMEDGQFSCDIKSVGLSQLLNKKSVKILITKTMTRLPKINISQKKLTPS